MAGALVGGLAIGVTFQSGPKPAKTAATPSPPPAPKPFPLPIALPAPLPAPALAPEAPAWRRYAVAAPAFDGRPTIAIVIDDVGVDRLRSARAIRLPAPLTIAVLPYADAAPKLAAEARAAGHELLVHLPMEPDNDHADPGPQALLMDLDEAERLRRLRWNLGRIEGYVGVNNHMGSRFTADESRMRPVLAELKAHGLLWLDSRTGPVSAGPRLAQAQGIPAAERDVFLDYDGDGAHIGEQLAQTERIARKHGTAIAIGHPYDATLAALARWLPEAGARGLMLVPVSAIVARRTNAGRG